MTDSELLEGAVIAAILGDPWPKATDEHGRAYLATYRPLVPDFRVPPEVAHTRLVARGLLDPDLSFEDLRRGLRLLGPTLRVLFGTEVV